MSLASKKEKERKGEKRRDSGKLQIYKLDVYIGQSFEADSTWIGMQ